MSKIKLLHSYLYIEKTKNLNIKNNKIYDIDNNFVCGLSNIPYESDGIKIILEKNLVKSKQSKKIVNTYYEKNNIKVYIEFDTKITNINDNLENKDFLIKLLKNNYLNFMNLNDNLFNCLCLNKNYQREFFRNYSLYLNDQYILQIYNLSINLANNTIKKINNHSSKKVFLNFNILYSDYLLGTIKIINNCDYNNLLVICSNNNIKKLWKDNLLLSNIKVLNIIEVNYDNIKNYNNIIFCDIEEKIYKNIYSKFFKNTENKYLYIFTNYEHEKILDFLKKFYSILNLSNNFEENYKITIQTLYNYSKCIICHKFYDKLIESNYINKIMIKNNDKISPLINLIRFNIKKNFNLQLQFKPIKCAICLDEYPENDFITLNCGHKFCKSCISKLQEYNLGCSICRTKISYYKKEVCEKSLFCKKNWYYVGSVKKTIIDQINKSNYNSIIYLENTEIYPLLNTLLCYYVPKKFKIILDSKYIFDKLEKNINCINFFYLKNKKKSKNECNYICLNLKNFYKKINYFEFYI